jgi:hypothetical protein
MLLVKFGSVNQLEISSLHVGLTFYDLFQLKYLIAHSDLPSQHLKQLKRLIVCSTISNTKRFFFVS